MKKKWRKHKSSIFVKLVGSYVIFTLIAIFITLTSLILFILFSSSSTALKNFPGLSVREDGTIEYLEEIYHFGGWVEELDSGFQVVKIYGEKRTEEQSYTPEQILSMTALLNRKQTNAYGRDAVIAINGNRYDDGREKYHIFWQEKRGGYYLIFYPLDAFRVVYNMDIDKAIISNVNAGELLAVALLLLADVFAVSFYISRKIKRPLDSLIMGMKRVEQGEEQVELSMHTEREFVEIGQAFNRMTKQLHLQKAENEKMSRSRQRMLLELSHDIKTPVATIKSFACALQEGMVPEEELSRYYQTIALKAERVNTMSEDLFTMLKMENADYRLELKPVNLAELSRRICGEYYGEISEAGFAFEIDIPKEQVFVRADEKLLSRVIGNLLTNARKYNRTGKEIRIGLWEQEQVILRVEDDGEEILPDVRDAMFHAFVRGESARSSRGGTGLGLAIAKAVMEKHGGEIFYKRKEGWNVFELLLFPLDLNERNCQNSIINS